MTKVKKNDPETVKPSKLKKIANWNKIGGAKIRQIEDTASFRICAIIAGFGSFLFLGLSFIELQEEFKFREEERANWQIDRVEQAWSRLLNKVGGNTGKGTALSYLVEQGETLQGIDISCENMGGTIYNDWCSNPVILSNMDIDGSKFLPAKYFHTRWNLSYVQIKSSNIFNVSFFRYFDSLEFDVGYLRNVYFYGSGLNVEPNIYFNNTILDKVTFVDVGKVHIVKSALKSTTFEINERNILVEQSTIDIDKLPRCLTDNIIGKCSEKTMEKFDYCINDRLLNYYKSVHKNKVLPLVRPLTSGNEYTPVSYVCPPNMYGPITYETAKKYFPKAF